MTGEVTEQVTRGGGRSKWQEQRILLEMGHFVIIRVDSPPRPLAPPPSCGLFSELLLPRGRSGHLVRSQGRPQAGHDRSRVIAILKKNWVSCEEAVTSSCDLRQEGKSR